MSVAADGTQTDLAATAGPELLSWSQAFDAPEGTPQVVVAFDDSARSRWLWLQLVVLLALVVMALPERRRLDPDPDLTRTLAGRRCAGCWGWRLMFGRANKKVRLEPMASLGAKAPVESLADDAVLREEDLEVDLAADLDDTDRSDTASDDTAPDETPSNGTGEAGQPPRGPRRRRQIRGEGGSPISGARPLLIGLAVAAVLTLLATLLQQPTPEVAEGAVTIEPIGSTVLLCPEPGAGTDLGVRVTAAVVPGQPGQEADPAAAAEDGAAAGAAGLETLPGKESAQSKILVPGGQAQIEAFGSLACRPSAPTATGTLAPGLVADQWGRDPGGRGRGMASTACAPAASEFWFVGGGAIAGRQTRIVLVNPDETSAVVDVVIRGPQGPHRRARGPRPGREGPGPAGRPPRRAGPGGHGHRRAGARSHRTRRGVRRRRAAGGPGQRRHRLAAAGGSAGHSRLRSGHHQRTPAHACCRSRLRATTTRSSTSA